MKVFGDGPHLTFGVAHHRVPSQIPHPPRLQLLAVDVRSAVSAVHSRGMFKEVPADLFERVEPSAGEVLLVCSRRNRAEFHPDWSYICTPDASADAVVAALPCSTHDVPPATFEAVLRVHALAACAALEAGGVPVVEWLEGRCPVSLSNEVYPGWCVLRRAGGQLLRCARLLTFSNMSSTSGPSTVAH